MPRRSCSTSSSQELSGKMFMRRRSVSKMFMLVCFYLIFFGLSSLQGSHRSLISLKFVNLRGGNQCP